MKKILIAALTLLSLSCVHAATDTGSVSEPHAVTRKATTVKKHVVKKHVARKPVTKRRTARRTARETTRGTHRAVARRVDYSRRIVRREPIPPGIRSSSVLIQDQATGAILYQKNADAVVPIASISKLMTAMVTLDAHPDMNDVLTITEDDVDRIKGTHSRLTVGTQLTRKTMLLLALMASENRAAYALSRYYPGGRPAFITAMNRKAKELGLTDTHFIDPTGLTSANVSSARDLVKMVAAAHQYPLIREFTTTPEYTVDIGGREQVFHNTNSLVRNENRGWDIGLSKTGFINEAGKCLVMQAWFDQKPMIIVLLDSWGRMTRVADAVRIKNWVEHYALVNKKANTI